MLHFWEALDFDSFFGGEFLGNETQNLRAPHPGIFLKIAPPLALTPYGTDQGKIGYHFKDLNK